MEFLTIYWPVLLVGLLIGAVAGYFYFRPRQQVRLSDQTPLRPHMAVSGDEHEGRGISDEAAAATSDVAGQFLGTHENRLDAKGRVSIPSSFRTGLRAGSESGECAMIMRPSHAHPCIEAWPIDVFNALAEPVDRMDLFSDVQDDLTTALYADAHRLETDKEGRVLLPETLASVRAARRNLMQTSLNLAYGSAMASIGLTVTAIAVASIWLEGALVLGLGPVQMVLLLLTAVVALLFLVVFPAVEPLLPYSDVTVEADPSPGAAGQVPRG